LHPEISRKAVAALYSRAGPDPPEAVRLSVSDALALGEAALGRIGYDACIITDQLIDNALCGYWFAGLPRILAIAREAKTRDTRVPIAVVHEMPASALVDGGNNVGLSRRRNRD
jgi:hypothetical protein